MQDFRKLNVWQKSHQLTLDVYAVSATLSHPKYFSFRDQLLRSAVSSRQTLPKAVAGQEIGTFADSSGIRWDPPANLSIIFFLPAILDWSRSRTTARWPVKS